MARVSSEAARHIGRKIKKLRESKGWSQDELAARCGIDSANIRSYEAGRSMMNIQSLVRIATALGTTANTLVSGLTPDMFPQRVNVEAQFSRGVTTPDKSGSVAPHGASRSTSLPR